MSRADDGEWSLDFAALVDPVLGREPLETVAARVAEREAVLASALAEPETAAPSSPTLDHASYLGASDIGAILGLDPMRTALDVWAEKTRRVRFAATPETEAGSDHEAGVVAGAARRLKRGGLVERVEYPGPGTIINGIGTVFARGATLDSVVHHRDHGECALEAKLVGAGMSHAWGPEPAGAEGIPERTLVQVHWQTLHLRESRDTRAPIAYVAADIHGTDRRLYEVPIDDDLIDSLIVAGREWWRRHVSGGEMPEPTARDVHTLGQIYPHAKRPLSPIAPDSIVRLADEYDVISEYARRVAGERDRVGALLRAELGEAEGYRWQGGKVTWREDGRGSRRLHVKIRRAA